MKLLFGHFVVGAVWLVFGFVFFAATRRWPAFWSCLRHALLYAAPALLFVLFLVVGCAHNDCLHGSDTPVRAREPLMIGLFVLSPAFVFWFLQARLWLRTLGSPVANGQGASP
ncbi:hypothetical protein [Arenimonas oryziterrae]|uniref:Uncharacterized protein n=1 Tax=Arenimonas oryziterrae DSM 21050 = YC6267 TaxID=1121015 RepID=A0A091AZ31_9GAMM|nr:hypothetical protein [Arenimonas oryziterrae]KFN44547.1 hypothetical protein N789_00640 [Arenimonas oryziterrae DSM 21050 = YC6267]